MNEQKSSKQRKCGTLIVQNAERHCKGEKERKKWEKCGNPNPFGGDGIKSVNGVEMEKREREKRNLFGR